MTRPEEHIDNLLDQLSLWRKQAQTWEQLAHELANTITKNDNPTPAITKYNRTVRQKYRAPRLK